MLVMSESFVGFKDVLSGLSSQRITKTSDGKININGNVLTAKDFDKLYYKDASEMLQKYEADLSPEFEPSKQLFQTLDTLSSPVLKNTSIPAMVNGFYKKMRELAPDSKTIVEGYGIKYDGEDIINMAKAEIVEPEEPMGLLKYKSLEAQDKDAPDYVKPVTYDQVMDFYSPEKNPGAMRGLLKEDKITPEFSELHQEMLDGVEPEKRKEYIKALIDESKENARTHDEFSEEVFAYANHQIIPDTELKQNITGEFLKKQYLAGAIGIARVIAIYETAPKYYSAVDSILAPDEILNAYGKGEVSDDALVYAVKADENGKSANAKKENKIEFLLNKNVEFGSIMYLYLHHDELSVTEIEQAIDKNKVYSNLEMYIDEGSSPARIKELYDNFLIDYGCIKSLQIAGILTERDMQKYHFSHGKEQVYKEISETPKLKITGNAEFVPTQTTGAFINKKSDPNRESVITTYKMLGALENQEEAKMPVIEHKTETGEKGFLDGYRVVGLKRANLVAFVPPMSKTEENYKPAYLMPYEESAYIIRRGKLPEGFLRSDVIREVPVTEKMHEQIIKTANRFEEAKSYLEKLGYDENMDFNQCLMHMLEEYQKIKIKGEN